VNILLRGWQGDGAGGSGGGGRALGRSEGRSMLVPTSLFFTGPIFVQGGWRAGGRGGGGERTSRQSGEDAREDGAEG